MGFVAAGILLSCGGNSEMTKEERERLALEKVAGEYKRGAVLEALMDSLRAKKARYNITRDEYWDGKGGVIANDYFELWYPQGGSTIDHAIYTFGHLVSARKKFLRTCGREPEGPVTIICSSTMETYKQYTGMEWWMYAKVSDDEIHYQPIEVLFARNLGDVAIPRGYYEWAIYKLSGDKAPRWFAQGFASLLTDEEYVLEIQLPEFANYNCKMNLEQIDSAFKKMNDKKDYRIAAYNAYRMVRRLVAAHGRDKACQVIVRMGEGKKAKAAFEEVYGQPYDDLLEYALDFEVIVEKP